MDTVIECSELTKAEKKQNKRKQSLGEEIGNAITHGLGAIFAIVATVLMLVKANTTLEYVSTAIFGAGFFMLYIMSCLYHAFKSGTKVKRIFRYFDHTSIYLLIGGTYAPVLLLGVGGTLGWVYFIVQWVIIALGITLKCVRPGKNTVIHTIFCLILGWSGLSVLPNLWQFSPTVFWLILTGGIVYSIGIAFYASSFKYSHFIWHFFVLGGTIVHFLAIYMFIL